MKAVDLDILRVVAKAGLRLVASVETLRGNVGASSPKVVRLALDRLEGEALITSESAHVARGAKAYALTEAGRSRVAAAARAPLSETKSTEGEVSGNAKGEDKGKERANLGTNGGTVSKSMDQRSNEEQANNNGNHRANNKARGPRKRAKREGKGELAMALGILDRFVGWLTSSGLKPPALSEDARAAVMSARELSRAHAEAVDAPPPPRHEAREHPPARKRERTEPAAPALPDASELDLSSKVFASIQGMHPHDRPAPSNVTWDFLVGNHGGPRVVTHCKNFVVAVERGSKPESPVLLLLKGMSAVKKGKPWELQPEASMPWAHLVAALGKLPEPFREALGHLLPPEPEGTSARVPSQEGGATGPEGPPSLPKPELDARRKEWRAQAEREWDDRDADAYSVFDGGTPSTQAHVVEQHVRARVKRLEEEWRSSSVSSWSGS